MCLVSGKLSISTTIMTIPGYREIYKGSLSDADVYIEKYLEDPPDIIRQVSCSHSIWPDCHALTSFEGTLQGGHDVEVPQSPKYHVLQRCHPQPPSTRVGMDKLQRVERICQGKSACRLNWPCEFIPSRPQASPHPIFSCSALPKGLVIFTCAM